MKRVLYAFFALTVAFTHARATEFLSGKGVNGRPMSYVDQKFAHTVRQQRDFTCGAAAFSTLLKYHYDMPVTEEMIFSIIVNRYKPSEFQMKAQQGFSLEDLIFVAEKLGFQAQAAKIEVGELEKLNGPVIIKVTIRKNEHFVVLRKKTSERAYVSDPLFGESSFDNSEFSAIFDEVVLAVWPSYITENYFSGLSVIRDPISVRRGLIPSEVGLSMFSSAADPLN